MSLPQTATPAACHVFSQDGEHKKKPIHWKKFKIVQKVSNHTCQYPFLGSSHTRGEKITAKNYHYFFVK